ncbi:MAG: SDR family NAD(P)-dependent oxidoreductase [Myxococcota bacterium]
MRRLEGRVAVVTGAASGIGRATSELLARRGCDVALVDIDEERAEIVAQDIAAAGRKATVHVADVADAQRMAALADEVASEHGQIHILMNNAGVAAVDTFANHDMDDFAWVVGVNFWGVVRGCKAFLPQLLRADEAHIVNVSSMFGFIGLPTQSAYCATKFAVRGFSEALWCEFSGTSVGVTCVHPGGIRTNIIKSSRTPDAAQKSELVDLFETKALLPERAAEKIVRGIERRKQRVVICRESFATDWAKRAFPALTQRLVAWSYRRNLDKE